MLARFPAMDGQRSVEARIAFLSRTPIVSNCPRARPMRWTAATLHARARPRRHGETLSRKWRFLRVARRTHVKTPSQIGRPRRGRRPRRGKGEDEVRRGSRWKDWGGTYLLMKRPSWACGASRMTRTEIAPRLFAKNFDDVSDIDFRDCDD